MNNLLSNCINPYIRANEHFATALCQAGIKLRERIGRLALAILEYIPVANYLVYQVDIKYLKNKFSVIESSTPSSNATSNTVIPPTSSLDSSISEEEPKKEELFKDAQPLVNPPLKLKESDDDITLKDVKIVAYRLAVITEGLVLKAGAQVGIVSATT